MSKVENQEVTGLGKGKTNPYYYFGNYEDTIDMIKILEREKNMKYGIIRHAIFLEKHIVILDNHDYKKWNEDYYDCAIILESDIINDNDNRQMILAIKKDEQFTTISYKICN